MDEKDRKVITDTVLAGAKLGCVALVGYAFLALNAKMFVFMVAKELLKNGLSVSITA